MSVPSRTSDQQILLARSFRPADYFRDPTRILAGPVSSTIPPSIPSGSTPLRSLESELNKQYSTVTSTGADDADDVARPRGHLWKPKKEAHLLKPKKEARKRGATKKERRKKKIQCREVERMPMDCSQPDIPIQQPRYHILTRGVEVAAPVFKPDLSEQYCNLPSAQSFSAWSATTATRQELPPPSPLSLSSELVSQVRPPTSPRSALLSSLPPPPSKRKRIPWHLTVPPHELEDLVLVLQTCLVPLFPLTPGVHEAYFDYINGEGNPADWRSGVDGGGGDILLTKSGFTYGVPKNRQPSSSLRMECPYAWIVGLRDVTRAARAERDLGGCNKPGKQDVDRVVFTKRGLQYHLARPDAGVSVGNYYIAGIIRRT